MRLQTGLFLLFCGGGAANLLLPGNAAVAQNASERVMTPPEVSETRQRARELEHTLEAALHAPDVRKLDLSVAPEEMHVYVRGRLPLKVYYSNGLYILTLYYDPQGQPALLTTSTQYSGSSWDNSTEVYRDQRVYRLYTLESSLDCPDAPCEEHRVFSGPSSALAEAQAYLAKALAQDGN
ncbi:MAG: hypothetical protein ACO1RX_23610 [Candidatus Sericytochromatia bacterium]